MTTLRQRVASRIDPVYTKSTKFDCTQTSGGSQRGKAMDLLLRKKRCPRRWSPARRPPACREI